MKGITKNIKTPYTWKNTLFYSKDNHEKYYYVNNVL